MPTMGTQTRGPILMTMAKERRSGSSISGGERRTRLPGTHRACPATRIPRPLLHRSRRAQHRRRAERHQLHLPGHHKPVERCPHPSQAPKNTSVVSPISHSPRVTGPLTQPRPRPSHRAHTPRPLPHTYADGPNPRNIHRHLLEAHAHHHHPRGRHDVEQLEQRLTDDAGTHTSHRQRATPPHQPPAGPLPSQATPRTTTPLAQPQARAPFPHSPRCPRR